MPILIAIGIAGALGYVFAPKISTAATAVEGFTIGAVVGGLAVVGYIVLRKAT